MKINRNKTGEIGRSRLGRGLNAKLRNSLYPIGQCCPAELSLMVEMFYSALSNMIATSHMLTVDHLKKN